MSSTATSGAASGNLDCPDHWHATFAIFVPSTRGQIDGHDTGQRIDWATPTAPNGKPYYNFGTAPTMSTSVHLHQDGPEMGESAHGPAQFHFEGGHKCVGIQNAFHIIDVDLSADYMRVESNTPLSQANPTGPWETSGSARLRFFLQQENLTGAWVWREKDLGSHLHYQLQDGEAMLVAFGDYTDDAIATMQDAIPAPTNRPHE